MIRPVLTRAQAGSLEQAAGFHSVKIEATMPCDGILRGLRITGVTCIHALQLNGDDLLSGARLQPELVAGEALDWGHVNEGDKVELCVEPKPKETPQAMLLVEPKQDRLLVSAVLEWSLKDGRHVSYLTVYAETTTRVTRVVVTPDEVMFARVSLMIGDERLPFEAHVHAFEKMDPKVGIMTIPSGKQATMRFMWAQTGAPVPITVAIYGRDR